ncbi:MAG: flagellar biosynthesis protein FlhB [Nitrospina sp.]|nr:flagellar biosynthesis protein FlhB [Nitrospina sp.]MBT7271706.1 flagellar biosynthesis protein FlhB [Nitrospina sp.]
MTKNEKKLGRSAVSLKYDNQIHKSPVVTAKGKGLIAEKIIALAKKNNVPIKEDPDLVHLLSKVDLNKEIPASLYHLVAELLSFVYRLNGQYSSKIK